MTARVNRPHLPKGRAPKLAPAGAAARIEALAALGHSLVGISRGLNTSKVTMARWIDDDPALAEALARGRESERFALHSVLYKAATEGGNIVAAMFLLKARHGYREGDQNETGNRVQITFALPGALSLEQFKVIENERDDRAKQLSRTTIVAA